MQVVVIFKLFVVEVLSSDYHPSIAMSTGSTNSFQIDRDNQPKCRLKTEEYQVIKLHEGKEFNFYVVTGNRFELDEEDGGVFKATKYKSQIGYATCLPGWIDLVRIDNLARGCGISTVLSELCMIDPQIYSIDNENEAIENVENSEGEQANFIAHHLRNRCSHLIGLVMVADPLTGAYAYFSGAIRLKYEYMVVHLYDRKRRECTHQFLSFNVKTAQTLYKEDTGKIGDIDGSGYEAKWYFCKYMYRGSVKYLATTI